MKNSIKYDYKSTRNGNKSKGECRFGFSEPMYSKKDLMERYGVSAETITNWVKSGNLPAPIMMSRFPRWRLSELVAFENKKRKV